MVDTDDIECRREQWRYYARLRIQREDNESRNIRLARCRANYGRQRQQTLGGDHILVEQNQGDAYREQAVERTEEVENINDQNHEDGYREQGVDNTFDGTAHVINCMRGRYNCAKDFKEGIETIRYQLPQPKTCHFCNARLFHRETSSMCCKDGKISFPNIPICPEFMELICEQTPRGKHFRQYIRFYNNMFAFTSMGVHVDESVASNSRGIYTFRAQCAIYHRIGSLLPHTPLSVRHLQLYIYDTDLEIQRRMSQSVEAHEDIVQLIQRILDMHNPFVEKFRQLSRSQNLHQCKLLIKEQPLNQPQYCLPNASQVAAIIVGGEEASHLSGREILVQTFGGNLINVQDTAGFYDPLQYPILFPFGTYGWDINTRDANRNKVSCRDYYAYIFQIHDDALSMIWLGGRLSQQYVVDNYVKIETHKLRWFEHNQDSIRADLYQGLQDAFNEGESHTGNVGHRTILPSSFVGSPRDMIQRFQDAMSLVQKFGKPDLFITMTCNPGWEEIQNELLPAQTAQDRPDLLARVFKSKFEELKDDIVVKGFSEELLYTCSIKSVKYLYKYVYKGPDRVSMEVRPGPNYDEVQQYIDARWQAAEQRGLLENDNSIRQCLLEARDIRMPSALRRLFATILVFCLPTGVRELWSEFYPYMVEDYPSTSVTTETHRTNKLLKDLGALLLQHGKHITEYDLPISTGECDNDSVVPRLIQDELTVPNVDEELTLIEKLNNNQRVAFEKIMTVIDCKESMIFFIDGLGGTGKTFLYRTILATLRKAGHIAIATATSGIAATLLPGGRTSHSRFKIPLTPDASSTCSISKQSDLAELIRRATIIIWNEAPMVNRHALESLDRTFKDIMEVNLPFGGKVLILGGDFRQVLPVVPKGTRTKMIDACIVKSPLWKDVKVLHLKQNMRSINDEEFAEYIKRIGDGNEPFIMDDLIKLPPSMAMQWKGQHSIYNLIDQVFPNLQEHANDARYMVDRALLTPINDDVEQLNAKIISQFPGDEFTLHSFDEVEGDAQHLYQQEFLNSISPGGLPPHILRLKKGAPIMLLRNIDPKAGLCNGTRLICHGCFNNVIDAEILIGQYAGTRVFLPRIPLKTTENVHLPFVMIRRQFPVRLSFALTINKAQGQIIPTVGIYLPDHVFSHGQLYVALTRGVSQSTTKLLVQKGTIPEEEGRMPNSNVRIESTMLSNGVHAIPTTHWENWKDDQLLLNMEAIDNKVRKLEIYSPGWGFTIRVDKKELWKEVKRVLELQKLERFVPFFKSQAEVDHFTYMELCNIITRFMANAAGKQLECGTNSIAPPTSPP
ncbi:uncharacterized protein LOC142608899 [Castanea sativa]|uniref:uncharacterized protein LOC142608899 n=1 Tax=Castanea sativa TaxID=21020 RepID=UPI003F651E98